MVPIGEMISNALGAVKEYFGWARERQALNNNPEMQANAKSEQDAKAADEARKKVAEGDTNTIREGLS